jgi:hypothetical protein
MSESVKKTDSKPIETSDVSGSEFTIEMLNGDPTYGINFDRVQWDNKNKNYIVFENLLCSEDQFPRGITPYTSHPNRYFHPRYGKPGNAQKFISLWEISKKLEAKLYLVNYSKKGTKYENEVLLMEVQNVDPKDMASPVKTIDKKMTRKEYSKWFREMNQRGKSN